MAFKVKLAQPAADVAVPALVLTATPEPEKHDPADELPHNFLDSIADDIQAAVKDIKKDRGAQSMIADTMRQRWPGARDVERALLYLDGRCDGAITLDGVGFNGRDTHYGKDLARQIASGTRLTPNQLTAAYKMIGTYKNTQLAWLDWDAIAIDRAKHDADRANTPTTAEERRARDAAEEEFAKKTTNAELASWVASYDASLVPAGQSAFVQSLLLAYHNKKRPISPGQIFWLKRMMHRFPMPEAVHATPVDTLAHDAKEKRNAENIKIADAIDLAEEAGKPADLGDLGAPVADSVHAPSIPAATGFRLRVGGQSNNIQSSSDAIRSIRTIQQRRLALNPDGSIPTIRFTRQGRDVEIIPDPSQWNATQQLIRHQFGCLTGAAGTGKTTVERLLVMNIEDQLEAFDISQYGARAQQDDAAKAPQQMVSAVAFMAFTGKAMQQMKRALPEMYHNRCMTIHLGLGFHPEFEEYEAYDTELQRVVVKMKRKFVPYYNEFNKMPWRTIFLDEASMIPIALWEQFRAALRDDCRVYMIGDINQLPPVHGRSVFGFAMLKWPSFELTQIHRQKGENNPIVDNAWRVLRGELPEKVPGICDMVRLDPKKSKAQNQIVQAAMLLSKKGEFNPYDREVAIMGPDGKITRVEHSSGDMLIASQNIDVLGQEQLNEKLMTFFNPAPPSDDIRSEGRRVIVSAGYEKFPFAVGDKVMATVNNHEVGITNGMTGRIVHIGPNGKYAGKQTGAHFSDDDIDNILNMEVDIKASTDTASADEKDEDFKKRAASHILTVDFGIRENGERHVIDFSTTGEVSSLMMAYAATCHKCQGSEFDTIIIVCHSSNHRMLYREWLYTAMTRAAKRYVLMYDDRGLHMALKRQRITGANLREKAQAFNEIIQADSRGESVTVPTLPEPKELEETA